MSETSEIYAYYILPNLCRDQEGCLVAMGTPPTSFDFETFYHGICTDLQNKGEVGEFTIYFLILINCLNLQVHTMSKQFSLMGDDNERMK